MPKKYEKLKKSIKKRNKSMPMKEVKGLAAALFNSQRKHSDESVSRKSVKKSKKG